MRSDNEDSGAIATPSVGAAGPGLARDDTSRAREQLSAWHGYEGRPVSIALADGTVLSDCVLVSAGRAEVQTLWILTEQTDIFIRRADVAEMWLAAGNLRNRAA